MEFSGLALIITGGIFIFLGGMGLWLGMRWSDKR